MNLKGKKLKMLNSTAGSNDGINVKLFEKDKIYEIGELGLGISEKVAEIFLNGYKDSNTELPVCAELVEDISIETDADNADGVNLDVGKTEDEPEKKEEEKEEVTDEEIDDALEELKQIRKKVENKMENKPENKSADDVDKKKSEKKKKSEEKVKRGK
jgi:hypothetical protein